MIVKNKKYNFILLTLIVYTIFSSIYIFLDVNGKINISNPIGATLNDQDNYHLPQINYFLQNDVNLSSYVSFTATTPGQHLIYAGILYLFNIKQVDGDTIMLRLLHLFFNLLVILSIWVLFYSISYSHLSILYLLPVIFSPYFINASLYVTTDNIAIGLVTITLLLVLRSNFKTSNMLFANLLNALSLLCRQNTIWLQVPIFIKNINVIYKTKKYYSLLFHILPIIILSYFLIIWGGLTPKEFQQINSKGLNFSSVLYSISLFAILSIFYFFDFKNTISNIDKKMIKKLLLIGGVVGLTLGILIPSTTNHSEGRWGGYLWRLSAYLPYILDRSFLFITLTIIGSAILSFIFYMLYMKKEYLVIISFLAWLISTIGSYIVFHRYFEPILIIFISIFALILKHNNKKFSYGPILLALIMLLMFFSSFSL